jgi:hypothetical protein
MNHDDIVRLAKKSGLWSQIGFPKELIAFAELVAAHTKENDEDWIDLVEAEREACAQECERQIKVGLPHSELYAQIIRRRVKKPLVWPFPERNFKHAKPGEKVPLGLDDYEDALL